MSVWKQWLFKIGAGQPVTWPTGDTAGHATCPYCGGGAVERSPPAGEYPIWESDCGAIGSGSPMYVDLDDVADGLLAALDIPGSVSEPCIPTDSSGVLALQHYDISKSLYQLWEILRAHDVEMQPNTANESGLTIYAIWVRRRR